MNNFIIQVIASLGGAAVITGLSLTWFGKKIVERQIEKSTEKAKYKIEAEFDRISKIQSHEFNILPELWHKLLNLMGNLSYITNPVKEFPDLNRMTKDELIENLGKKDWPEHIKKQILESTDKEGTYLFWAMKKAFFDTEKLLNDFHNYYLINKIFLTGDMDNCLEKIDSLCLDVLVRIKGSIREIGINWELMDEGREILNQNLENSKIELSKLIQKRLHFHQVK